MKDAGFTATTAAFLAIGSAFPPAQALALAGQTFAHSQPELASSLDAHFMEGRELVQEVDSDTNIYFHNDVPGAQASATDVYLNPSLAPHLNTAVVDWIVGHELGHIKSQDALAAVGRSFVIGQLKADRLQDNLISGLRGIHHRLNRESEFDADLEGLSYAVSRGHSRDTVLASVEGFLSAMPRGFENSHPEAGARLERLRKANVSLP
jgi:hypothetical protein